MTRREKFFKTIKREMEGYVPFAFSLCPSQLEKFKQKTGKTDFREYFNMPLREVKAVAVKRDIDFSKYFKDFEGDVTYNEWGVAYVRGSVEHFKRMESPMESFQTIDDFAQYPYPDPDKDYLWDALPDQIEELKKQDVVVMAGLAMTIFEIAWYLRGMETFMIDMVEEPEIACYHMDRILDIRCKMARKYAAAGADILHLGDDVSTQQDMMISPNTWRKFLKPRLKKVIDAAREVNPDILIDYHGDGNLSKIISDLIEIGVDVLNPVQPECMDPVDIKELYGDRLSFRGTIGTQTTLPFGTAAEVDAVCKEMIEKVGKGGGLVLAPTHVIEPEVPWENIEAFINAIKKYSKV